MTAKLASPVDLSARDIAVLLEDAYRDYVVPVRFPVAAAVALLRQDSIDLEASRIVEIDGRRAGIALVARRGRETRLAALAVVPEARGRGIGSSVLATLLEEARSRGDRRVELEVIETNTGAVRLYREAGFRTLRRLLQYRGREPADATAAPLVPAALPDVAALVDRDGLSDLPWQISGTTLAQSAGNVPAFRSGAAWAAVDVTDPGRIRLRALVVETAHRRRGQARRLLESIAAAFPERNWFVSAHSPEELDEPLRRLGFVRERGDLSQLHMAIDLA